MAGNYGLDIKRSLIPDGPYISRFDASGRRKNVLTSSCDETEARTLLGRGEECLICNPNLSYDKGGSWRK